ncbi:Lipolytic enzyme [Pyrenophora teres f. maculata]|nr:Lipolytic enzyme [Pyrenophora teres f. maculata]
MFLSRLAVLLVGAAVTIQGQAVEKSNTHKICPNPSDGHWVDAFATMPQLTELANLPLPPFNGTGAVFVNSTIRQTLYMTVKAHQIRLKFSNVFGGSNLPITAVTVALPLNQTAGIHQILPKTVQKVTFGGKDSISVPNGALAVSDPINFGISPAQIITVTVYLASGQKTNSITGHPGSRTTSWFQPGNAVSSPSFTITNSTEQSVTHWYFISSVEAWAAPEVGSLLIIGDSITDGRGSTPDQNNRWPNLLLARMQKHAATKHISIGNLAAGGNRILADGLGPNAFGRIDRDVLAHPGVKYAMVFEGVNDIGSAAATTAAQDAIYGPLIQAYEQIVTLMHSHGIPVFGATITPFSAPSNFTGQPYSRPEREFTRQRVNKWIRESGVFDAVVDFDKMLANPSVPSQLDPRWESVDYLHPGVAGYHHLADEFPLGIFEEWEDGADEFSWGW